MGSSWALRLFCRNRFLPACNGVRNMLAKAIYGEYNKNRYVFGVNKREIHKDITITGYNYGDYIGRKVRKRIG